MTRAAPPGRRCLYCGKVLAATDTVAMCTVCFVGHHMECWQRNGRCSTFRCPGEPRRVAGDAYGDALNAALELANAGPLTCVACGGDVYPGHVSIRHAANSEGRIASKLVFVGRPRRGKKGLSLREVFRRKTWDLPGAQLSARSCVRCHALYLWGQLVDRSFLAMGEEQALERYCILCGSPMYFGELPLSQARFVCDTTPRVHDFWLLHLTLDRFIYNRWRPMARSLPAASCQHCLYTEIAGRPVYRSGLG